MVYAVGATADRRLDVPGEELPGVLGAGTVVGWYNADPDVPAVAVDLSAERAVVVGNGNVALDIARVLLSAPERLAGTDIADHALAALRGSSVREVVLLARRGPADAAYTAPEFLALRQLPGIAVVVASDEALPEVAEGKSALLDGLPVEAVDWTRPPPAGRRIVLRFLERPAEFFGRDRVEGVRLASGGLVPAGLVVRAIGFRGAPLPELPFDEATGTVPSRNGRVAPGSYVAGWVKRGPTGGIGANRACAQETVDALLDDAAAGLLPPPPGSAADFDRLVRRRCPEATGLRELRAIDRLERERGAAGGRPRVKLATAAELLSVRGR